MGLVLQLSRYAYAIWSALICCLLSIYRRWQQRKRQRIIMEFDNDGLMRSIEIGRLIAEGGFSYVYEAYPLASEDNDRHIAGNPDYVHNDDDQTKYALKRINCAGNRELIASCRREIDANKRLTKFAKNSRGQNRSHPNLLALISVKFVNDGDSDQNNDEDGGDVELGGLLSGSRSNEQIVSACYMLFPFIPHSLRGEITERNILMSPNEYNNYNNSQSNHARRRKPFSTMEVLQIFGGILDGLIAVHAVDLSHRDIKIENVMLRRMRGHHHLLTPVLVDLGSAGPLTVNLSQGGGRDTQSRRRALNSIVEDAASHTTMAYRPPELFEGGMMMTTTKNEEDILDYGKIDVW
jgi:serine/threonine protein kinase